MDVKDYIKSELDNLTRGTTRVLNTLTQQELMWRPAAGCNSMGLILFHIARSEDSIINGFLQGKPQVWVTGKWCNTCKMQETETGGHYTVDQVNAFVVPEVKDILAYYADVRAKTVEHLNSLAPDAFEKKVKLPFGEFTVAGVFAMVVSHTAGHTGEMSYLRGMLRGMDK
jgi:hypothetical protein